MQNGARGDHGGGVPAPPGQDSGERRVISFARVLVRVEIGYAALLVSAFVLPVWIGFAAWIPALVIAVAFAVGHALLARRRIVLPPVMLAYLGIYAAALVLSDSATFSLIEAGKFFAPPIYALAVAWAAFEAQTRKRLVLLTIAAAAIQLPVVIVQTIDNLLQRGGDAIDGVDFITGLLGDRTPGILTQVAILAAILVLSAGYLRLISLRQALLGGFALIMLGALSSTRASYVFVPLALGAVAMALWIVVRNPPDRRSLRAAVVAPLLAVAILILATGALYPGANSGLFGDGGYVEETVERDPGLSTGEQILRPLNTTVLPGRGKQVRVALELSVDGGADTFFLGRGIGATRFKTQAVLDETGASFDLLTRPEQQTNGVWIARVITETGYLGLLAFLGLLAYLVALTARNRELLRSPSWDGAVMLGLPGIAALTLTGAFFNTVLAIQPYATVFWALVGVAIAIDAQRRSASNRERETVGVRPRAAG